MSLFVILGMGGLSISACSWHFFSRFKAARHPFSVVAGLLPAGWLFALAMAISPCNAAWRPVVGALAVLVGTIGLALAWMDRRNRAALEALQRRLGGHPEGNRP